MWALSCARLEFEGHFKLGYVGMKRSLHSLRAHFHVQVVPAKKIIVHRLQRSIEFHQFL